MALYTPADTSASAPTAYDPVPVPVPVFARRRPAVRIVLAALAVAAAGVGVRYVTLPSIDQYRPQDVRFYAALAPAPTTQQRSFASLTELAGASTAVVEAHVLGVSHLATFRDGETTTNQYGITLEPMRVLSGSTAARDTTVTVVIDRLNDDPITTTRTMSAELPKQPAVWFVTLSRTSEDGTRHYALTATNGLAVQGLTGVELPLAGEEETAISAEADDMTRMSELVELVDRIP